MTDWKTRIREAWSHAVPAGENVLREDAPTEWVDAVDAQRWLSGKKWDEAATDVHQMEVEMPLPYLKSEACCYFLGSYLLHLADAFEDDYCSDLAPLHFSGFLGSVRFRDLIPLFSLSQREVLRDFARAMVANRKLFGLGEEFSAKLESGLRSLASAE